MKTVVNRGIIRFSPFHPCSHHPAQYLFSLALIPPGAITTVFPNHRHCCSPSHKPLSSSPSPSPLFFFLFRVAATMFHHCLPGSSNPNVTTSNTSWKPKIASILTFQSSNSFPSKTGKDPWMILFEPAMLHLDPPSLSYTQLLSQRFLYTRSWLPRTPLSHHNHRYDGENNEESLTSHSSHKKESQEERFPSVFFRVAATMLHHCLPPLHLFFLFCLSSFFIFVVMVNNIMLLTSFLYFTSTYLKKNWFLVNLNSC